MVHVNMYNRDIWTVNLHKPLKEYYADDWRDVITLLNSTEKTGHLYIYGIDGGKTSSKKTSVSRLSLYYLRDQEKFSYSISTSGGIQYEEIVHNNCKDPICDVGTFIKILDYPKYGLTDVRI